MMGFNVDAGLLWRRQRKKELNIDIQHEGRGLNIDTIWR